LTDLDIRYLHSRPSLVLTYWISFALFIYRDFCMCLSLISGENVSHGPASPDGHAAGLTSQHHHHKLQQHQDDSRETFLPLNLTSGKFNFNINSFLRALHPGNAVWR